MRPGAEAPDPSAPAVTGPPGPTGDRRARWWWVVGALLAVLPLGLVVATLTRPGSTPERRGAGQIPVTGQIAVPSGLTLIAMLGHDVPRFAAPGGAVSGAVPGRWRGADAALPVIDQQPGWLRVRLAQRPNGSTGWIRRTDATLVTSQYRIEIDVTARRLRLFDREAEVLDAPAGVGVEDFPTPTGQYFLALFAPPPGPGYGDFVLVTSAHSTTITDWDATGDALVAIHGPLGSDEAIGDHGAPVSHGCVRLHQPDLARLRPVPAGSPITIVGRPPAPIP